MIEIGPRFHDFSGNQKIIKSIYRCDCGKIFTTRTSCVKAGHTKSCGCLRLKRIKKDGRTVDVNIKPTYRCWQDMKTRCLNEKSKSYKNYGGRGIKISERWVQSFDNFLEDMGLRPDKNYSLDRIDNDGDYCIENCRWTDRATQERNKRSNRFITIDGETKCLTDWCKIYDLRISTFYSRVYSGMSDLDAILGK